MISSLRERFSDDHKIYFYGSFILPSHILSKKYKTTWKRYVTEFVGNYKDDLPKPFVFDEELVSWNIYWKEELKKGNLIPSNQRYLNSYQS